MTENYDDIVRKYYLRLRPKFINVLMTTYKGSKLHVQDVEDIYQEAFLYIQQQIVLGQKRENTDWNSYIIKAGLNMASKHYRKIGKTDSMNETDPEDDDKLSGKAQRINDLIKEVADDDDKTLYNDSDAQSILGDELEHTPEPCGTIIRWYYYSDITDAEALEEMPELKNTANIKARRWKCMKDLTYRVKLALYHAGFINVKPEKK